MNPGGSILQNSNCTAPCLSSPKASMYGKQEMLDMAADVKANS